MPGERLYDKIQVIIYRLQVIGMEISDHKESIYKTAVRI
jgi:hypothetical protein